MSAPVNREKILCATWPRVLMMLAWCKLCCGWGLGLGVSYSTSTLLSDAKSKTTVKISAPVLLPRLEGHLGQWCDLASCRSVGRWGVGGFFALSGLSWEMCDEVGIPIFQSGGSLGKDTDSKDRG